METFLNFILNWLPFSATVLIGILFLFILQKVFYRWSQRKLDNSKIYYQLTIFFLLNVLIIASIIASPLADTIKNQLLSLLGIFFTAAIALSSTTFLGNILAGVMVKVLGKIKPGDFVKIENNFGRVTELGILHTEIQTVDRDLTTLPNLYLVTNPVKVVRSSGTIISEDVSLGYDIHHNKIEKHLLDAANRCRLEEPFMHIQSLGDYSVTYRVSGFLKDVKGLLSAKAELREHILDCLHSGRVEIVSPSFMNQRVHNTEKQFIPKNVKDSRPNSNELPEDLIFDKAEDAETVDMLKAKLRFTESELVNLEKNNELNKEEKTKRTSSLLKKKEHILLLIKKKINENGIK